MIRIEIEEKFSKRRALSPESASFLPVHSFAYAVESPTSNHGNALY